MGLPLDRGQIVKGKYRVERVIGRGGMGIVVAARHTELDQRVAIKFLNPEMLANREVMERFAREARAASRIESDHVARVSDVGTLDDGTPFMVMEFLEGRDFSSVLDSGKPLPVPAVIRLVLEACEAISEAHRMGIVHRDIKPANLFLARRPDGRTRVKVLDFGISKMSKKPGERGVTTTGAVFGSAEYMSPEQLLNTREVDGRTDIWSLGVTMYELVTAQSPFEGETMPQVCASILARRPPRPCSINPAVPETLDAVIMKCLEKERDQRYATVGDLVGALRPFVDVDVSGVMPLSLLGVDEGPSPGADSETAPNVAASLGSGERRGDEAATEFAGAASAPLPVARAARRLSGTDAAISSDTRPKRGTGSPLLLIAVGIIATLGAAFFFGARAGFFHKAEASASARAAGADSTAMPASASSPEPSATPVIDAPPIASSALTPPATSPSASAQISVVTPPQHTDQVPKPRPIVQVPTPPKPPNDCNPPYTIDAKGDKHAKLKCL